MGVDTKIQWCDYTWSPWHGCAKVSPGCEHCYAEKGSHRNPRVLGVWGKAGTRVIARDWDKPRRWDRAAMKAGERRRVFPSICDPFEERADLEEARHRFMGLVAATPRLDWLVLTKRPEVAAEYFRRPKGVNFWNASEEYRQIVYGKDSDVDLGDGLSGWPPRNLSLGVSVENQIYADERMPVLLQSPAAVRFISYEPALGPVDFGPWLIRLDWVIIGGESGPKARPFDVAWARSTIRQCREAGVACFVKQLGASPYYTAFNPNAPAFDDDEIFVKLNDPKGGDIDEWPEDLRVQEFPR